MTNLPNSFKNSIKNAIGDSAFAEKDSKKESTKVEKYSNSLSNFAKDLKVSRQLIQQLVSIMGGNVKSAGSFAGLVDAEKFFTEQDKIESEQEARRKKEGKETSPTPVGEEDKVKSPSLFDSLGGKAIDKIKGSKTFRKAKVAFKRSKVGKGIMKGVKKFSDFKKMFSPASFMKAFGKYFAIAAIIGTLFVAFKDTFVEWASGLWESIKESFDEFVEKIKEWFNDIVKPIVDSVIDFISEWWITPIKNFWTGVGNFFVKYFEFWKDLITSPVETIKKVWDKFMSMIDGFKEFIKPHIEKLASNKLTSWLVPDFLKSWLGISAKPEISKEEDEAEKKKLERQQKEALDTERVRKQEEEKRYKGEDEIVRKRLGIEEKTMTMRAEEAKKVTAAPAPTPTPVPTPITKEEVTERKPTVQEAKVAPEKPAEKVSGMDDIKKMIIKHEGIRFEPYKDSLGLWTIGVGHLIGDGKSLPPEYNRKFSEKEVMDLFEKDFAHHVKIAEQTPGYAKANDGGKGAFIDLAFNMGKWWPKWPTTKKKLEESDFKGAAAGLQDSKWYEQVKGRAKTIVSLVAQAGDSSGGSALSSASTQVASGQREQQKPQTPIVVNAPTNNTAVVNRSQVASAPREDTSKTLVARAA